MPKLTLLSLLLIAGTTFAHAGAFSELCSDDGGTAAQCSCFEEQVTSKLNTDEQEVLVGMMNQDTQAIMKMAQTDGLAERMEGIMNEVAATCGQ